MKNLKSPAQLCLMAALALGWCTHAVHGVELSIRTHDVAWQQVDSNPSLLIFPEREEFSILDRTGRFIIAMQVGTNAPPSHGDPASYQVRWTIRRDGHVVAGRTQPIPLGMIDVRFDTRALTIGRYELHAALLSGDQVVREGESFFRYIDQSPPPQQGRVPLILPRGMSMQKRTFPVHGGVPFPKGALWDHRQVRVVDAAGRLVPSGVVVRSRWGCDADASIRWLGVDLQASEAEPYWPDRRATPYYLEYGPEVATVATPLKLDAREVPQGITVDTGAMTFLVRRTGFNLIDDVRLGDKPVLQSSAKHGLYIIDHEGSIYRAANDQQVDLRIEEQTEMRVVIRIEGWYVKDGTDGSHHHHGLPTDRISKFITRIEAYAGKPYVRILNTWVLTFDPFTVRLRDVGMSLPIEQGSRATFGVEDGDPQSWQVPAEGIYLIQHLPDAFAVEDGQGRTLAKGRRSAGWVTAQGKSGLVSVGHRDTWQRFPKQMQVRPDELRFHIWPAHGRAHPDIDELKHEEIHKLWFCHQGRELNLVQPMDYYYAAAAIVDNPSMGIYRGGGTAISGVFASAMGTAITSDLLIHFAGDDAEAHDVAEVFQAAPHVTASPDWNCASLAAGYLHPYDPDRFPNAEQEIVDYARGYWETQDAAGEYGMWLYRPWHHNMYKGDGKWELYRLYNAAHHYDPYMPWMLYARSGDPFYLTQGAANIRILTDLQVIHYDDPAYPHREFHGAQGRLVGSTRHTNGFNLWGGDHAVLGHQTCYNGIILAHYLTGDLRLREVVVDEWQRTIVSDRLNPEYARADRTLRPLHINVAREKNTALGELLDLYLFTHHPAVLAHVAPNLDHFVNHFIRPWGMPQHNAILHYGSEQARREIVAAVDERMGPPESFKDAKRAWFTHSPHENFAMALILQPDRDDVTFATYLTVRRAGGTARAIREQRPDADAFCKIPDRVNFMPRVMHAIANARNALPIDLLDQKVRSPHIAKSDRQGLRCVVRKDADQPFDITFYGNFQPGGFPLRVYGPTGDVVVSTHVPGGFQSPFVVTVPKDGQVGEYMFFVFQPGHNGPLFLPLTQLPGEVYQTLTWSQAEDTRFFVRFPSDQPQPLEITGPGHDFIRLALTQIDGSPLAESRFVDMADASGRPTGRNRPLLQADLPPQGGWLTIGARSSLYVRTPFVFSVSPERWFMPTAGTLTRPNSTRE